VKFSYFPHPLDPSVSYPLVVATLQGPSRAIELQCLVDSGADIDSFPVSVARKIGIPTEDCPTETIIGIGGQITCYLSEVKISIAGHSYKTEAQFLEPSRVVVHGQMVSRDIPPLLGRKNTFANFKIIFDEANQELELISYRK